MNVALRDKIARTCTNCALRHGGRDCSDEEVFSDKCDAFQIGKCFVCAVYISNGYQHNESICYAEDMSGFPCANFKR